jgi:hypothetical protein
MRGKVAKQLRSTVYGKEFSHRFRSYKRLGAPHSGQIVADERRHSYQSLKKARLTKI